MVRGFFGGVVVGSLLSVVGLGAASVWVGPGLGPLANAPVPEAQVNSPGTPAPMGAPSNAPANAGEEAAAAVPAGAAPDTAEEAAQEAAQEAAPDTAQEAAQDAAQEAAQDTAQEMPAPADQPSPDAAQMADDMAATQPAATPAPAPQASQPSVAEQPTAPAPAPAQRPSVAQSGPMIEAPAAPRLAQELPAQAVVDTNSPARPETSTELAPPDQPTPPPGQGDSPATALPAPAPAVPAPAAPAPTVVAAPAPQMPSRLPSVGQTQPAAPPAPPAALDLYASSFENPEGKPLMSIVLIDRGDFTGAVDALANFPYQVSFALDPSRPGAAAAMARYREAGFEVLALADIPETATAGDVEASLAATLAALPETVAVLEGDKAGLQGSREISDQVAAILGETGHGLVLAPRGLDTARKAASKAGLAAATLFRDFDSKGQDANAVRRFLDQAAFKAGQEQDGIIMVGRTRPETISALILWGLADRAERVALAPVSAVLKAALQAR